MRTLQTFLVRNVGLEGLANKQSVPNDGLGPLRGLDTIVLRDFGAVVVKGHSLPFRRSSILIDDRVCFFSRLSSDASVERLLLAFCKTMSFVVVVVF